MRRSLTPAQQLLHLRRNPIADGTGDLRQGVLVWRFTAQPSPIGRSYTVRIDLSAEGDVDVVVEDPNLSVLAAGRKLPHVYGENPVRLCLYLPGSGEWQPWMRLDETVVPWTYLWFAYFEYWLLNDDWLGGGKHPEPRAGRQVARRLRRRPESADRAGWRERS